MSHVTRPVYEQEPEPGAMHLVNVYKKGNLADDLDLDICCRGGNAD